MKLIKLVYIAHGWHLGLTGKPLIPEAVMAWRYGPVVQSVYHQFKHFGSGQVTAPCGSKPPIFDEDSRRTLLDRVWEKYGHLNGLQLSTLTHQQGSPWDNVYDGSSGKVIPASTIQDHYSRLAVNHA